MAWSDGTTRRIAETLTDVSPDQPMPDLWPQFDALPPVPLMVVRGALSDILSEETVDAMRARRADLETVEIAGSGSRPAARRRRDDAADFGFCRALRPAGGVLTETPRRLSLNVGSVDIR